MELKLKGTTILQKNLIEYQKQTRLVVNQGGRGSSKTYSLAQLFLTILFSEKNVLLTICRKTLPALKATAMRDLLNILKEQNIYRESSHNKSENTYKYLNNEIEFISIDEPQKIRGRKRDYLWLNEANEFVLEDFRQLNMRTEKQIYFDYNPSSEYHWIYDDILTRNDCKFIQSTYLDNPYLDKRIVKEIERLKGLDKNYWRVYGLGERGVSEAMIYTHWQYIDNLPDGQIIYGLDFGYNNPTALVKVVIKDQDNYCEEKLYKSYLTNAQLIEELKGLNIKETIYADCAEPQRIEEIRRAGFDIKPADKEVKKGIDYLKSHKLYITKSSVNLLKEIKSYSWREKDGKLMDEPVNVNNHILDGCRYAIYTANSQPKIDIRII